MKKIFIVLLVMMTLVACHHLSPNQNDNSKDGDKASENSKLKVTVTTSFLEDMINNLAKDFVEVSLIIPAGEDPHTYEPKTSDYKKIDHADMIFYHGLHFEGKMIEILEAKKGVSVSENFDKSKILSMDEDGKQVVDPHFWFDTDLYKEATKTMANALMEKLSNHKDVIQKNLDAYLSKLDQLKKDTIEMMNQIPKESRYLITPHDAFNYFSRQYDIIVMAPQGVSTDSEVDTKAISEISKHIVDKKIKAIFAETTTDPVRMKKIQESCLALAKHKVEVVSGEGKELFSDSLANKGHKGDTYIDMVKANVELIVKYLK